MADQKSPFGASPFGAADAKATAEAAAEIARKEQESAAYTASLVKMKRTRTAGDHPMHPETADVHPDEVAGMSAGGWVKA